MTEEEKLYKRIKKYSVVILFVVAPLTLIMFIYALICTGYMCGIEFFVVLFLITIPSALFLHPLLFLMACYKTTGCMVESNRKYIKFYMKFTVYILIIAIAFPISTVSSPMTFLTVSLLLMLAWGLDESWRKGIESNLKFIVFAVIVVIALLLSFASSPTPSLVVSFISMLIWSIVSVGAPIYMLIKELKSSANKKLLIISYIMPLIVLIEF